MNVDGLHYRTIWVADDGWTVEVIDQTRLPHELEIVALKSTEDAVRAIAQMQVRGAPLIGVTGAYGLALALREDASDIALDEAYARLLATRPTAVNLRWALEETRAAVRNLPRSERVAAAYAAAAAIAEDDVETCRRIGVHGAKLIADAARKKGGGRVNVLTHCNAGWLGTVDWGTALSGIYQAHDAGLDLHVWVDETRPRNQGAALTAWELGKHGVPHAVIADNAGGHLMQKGQVDLCIVGADRVTAQGDVANKIGTYLKALAARDTDTPFYVAIPYSTIDWTIDEGGAVPIEERDGHEITHIRGRLASGEIATVEIAAPGSAAANPAFDVTPARLVTALVTERGVAPASKDGLLDLYPERRGR
jgi:methylthioribose-1-phosphate isomerase